MKVKLLRTIENGCGDIFRKNSILTAKKRHGGYELTKKQRRKNGCIISVTRVQAKDFEVLEPQQSA
ncbi:hypothetical protein LCGC14_2216790 [marine sediment metagenome]|uniref:Uncharacterized protein n=1 Tax=marine sediment metagenome TaxID=412755 RepID=A0A0F9G7T4_9ZZZZ